MCTINTCKIDIGIILGLHNFGITCKVAKVCAMVDTIRTLQMVDLERTRT